MNNVAIIRCPSCGASTDPKLKNCEYCDNYLVRLNSSEFAETEGEIGFFSPLYNLYKWTLITGSIIAGLLYTIGFNFLSETQLLMISPIWFIAIHFGLAGYRGSKAVELIMKKEAKNFDIAIQKAANDMTPLMMIVSGLTLLPVFFIFPLKHISSPLRLAVYSSIIWAVILYLFIVLIFPSL